MRKISPIVRFAPSPTGYLHIGGARTALFNYLFAKRNNGKFLLRVEDTDKKRSTLQAITAIYEGLKWLGLDWDGDAYIQSQAEARHKQVAIELLKQGKAYYCYETEHELKEKREKAEQEGRVYKYDRKWRDAEPSKTIQQATKPSIRIKAPLSGEIVINDAIKGEVKVRAEELDDFIILRSDGTPTYMHSVVVDDFDMQITHIIRGDDHFTNSFRQKIIYDAMNWQMPKTCHIPLIHGSDGAKLSKRHGATSLIDYKHMGILPEAMFNYLLRLGWGHGDDEIFSKQQAIELFSLEGLGSAPAMFNLEKLHFLNHHYIKNSNNNSLAELSNLLDDGKTLQAINLFKDRVKNLNELKQLVLNLIEGNFEKLEISAQEKPIIQQFSHYLAKHQSSFLENPEQFIKTYLKDHNLKFKELGIPLRKALIGIEEGPSLSELIRILGVDAVVKRIG
jgi:glutamyl-tRNA synthetase